MRWDYYERRKWYARKFNLSKKVCETLTFAIVEQLDNCKNIAARRLLLGIGRQA